MRAVVVTCGAAGLLREAFPLLDSPAMGPPITFTHVLIDEAGQVRLYSLKKLRCASITHMSVTNDHKCTLSWSLLPPLPSVHFDDHMQ